MIVSRVLGDTVEAVRFSPGPRFRFLLDAHERCPVHKLRESTSSSSLRNDLPAKLHLIDLVRV